MSSDPTDQMSEVTKEPPHGKTCLWGFRKVYHKLGCTATEDAYRLAILNLTIRGIVVYLCSKNKGADLIIFNLFIVELFNITEREISTIIYKMNGSCKQ